MGCGDFLLSCLSRECRGAHASSGHHGVEHRHAAESSHSAKTSWLGKPELQDYVSFVGLIVEYMRCLHADQHERASSRDSAAPRTSLDASRTPGEEHSGHENEDESMYLILGGYSYGSLVASRLPPLPVLLSPFYSSTPAPPGSTPAEILLRAQHLAAETIAERRERGRDAFNKRRSPVTIGGEESDPEARRRSKEATRRSSRSLDLARGTEKLRRAWDKKHHHSGTSSPGPAVVEDSDEAWQESGNSDEGGGENGLMPPCRLAYLLISPLLPPTSLFIAPALATQGLPALSRLQFAAGLFGGRSQHAAASRNGGDAPVDPLLRCPTLAIWGEEDSFTSSKRLVRWAKGMQEEASSMSGRSGVGHQLGFQGVAVEGASHFWQERGVMARLRAEVREWAGRIG